MARYIDAEKLLIEMRPKQKPHESTYATGRMFFAYDIAVINEQPTADVVEVKHGEWLPYESEEPFGDESETTWYKCSVCGTDALGRCYEDEYYSYPLRTDYCPNCGAKMNTQ